MTRARKELVSLEDTPWYHLVNRCVRRAFLCGVDSISGRNYEHRKDWIEKRILQLANVFSIDVAAYAVMSNHYHVVVRVNQEGALNWNREEVLQRWTQLFAGSRVVQQYLSLEDKSEASSSLLKEVDELVEVYRNRLFDLSWFMKVLNESISRMANKEDDVKGHFWEGRFKSQALLDEQAILSVMAYVDLNPIRANLAEGLEDSHFTSIFRRLQVQGLLKTPRQNKKQLEVKKSQLTQSKPVHSQLKQGFKPERLLATLSMASLMAFDAQTDKENVIGFEFKDYIEFVEYMGQAIHPSKSGFIAENTPKLMSKLNLSPKLLEYNKTGLLKSFGSSIGSVSSLDEVRRKRGRAFVQGVSAARVLFGLVNSNF